MFLTGGRIGDGLREGIESKSLPGDMLRLVLPGDVGREGDGLRSLIARNSCCCAYNVNELFRFSEGGMLKKFVLPVLVLLATGGAFFAGVTAPDSLRTWFDFGQENEPTSSAGAEDAAESEVVSEDAADGTSALLDDEPPLADFDAMQSVSHPPEDSQWGVLVRRYATALPTSGLVSTLDERGVDSQTFRVKDENEKTWFAIIAGPYPERSQADRQRIRMNGWLGADFRPTLVIFPPPPPTS